MAIDPRALKPRTIVVHSTGTVHVLHRRKDDGSGWWMTDGSGLWDRAWESGDYRIVAGCTLRQLWRLLDDNGQIPALPTEGPTDA